MTFQNRSQNRSSCRELQSDDGDHEQDQKEDSPRVYGLTQQGDPKHNCPKGADADPDCVSRPDGNGPSGNRQQIHACCDAENRKDTEDELCKADSVLQTNRPSCLKQTRNHKKSPRHNYAPFRCVVLS